MNPTHRSQNLSRGTHSRAVGPLRSGVLAALVAGGSLFGCGGAVDRQPEFTVLDGEGRSEEERELNRAALETLRERAADAPPVPPERAAPRVVVLEPPETPSALTEGGALRRSAVDAFVAHGPHAVLGAVVVEPARDSGGSLLGFRIVELRQGSEFISGAGLGVGDIVSRVNGRSITLPENFMAVWEGLGEAEEVRVEGRQDGERVELVWPIDEDQ